MKFLFILNDPPYGTERSYNALRLATALAKQPETVVRVFLIGEGAACAHAGQHVPVGHYNIETMLQDVVTHNGAVGVCSTCMDARGISDAALVAGTKRSSMSALVAWSADAEKVFVF